MNKKQIAALAAVLVFVASAQGQGFINLDFESAHDLTYPGFNPVTNALPGWTADTGGTNQLSQISFDANGGVFLIANPNPFVIDGNYSVGLGLDSSISQTGLVPALTESLFFEMHGSPTELSGILSVSLGGQILPYVAISNGPHYILYGADVSTFAGRAETLTFSTSGPLGGGPLWILDDIEFSPEAVPEPGEFALTAFGIILLGIHRWRKSRRAAGGRNGRHSH